jgi:O-antigen/teichoic acid export membrane protein
MNSWRRLLARLDIDRPVAYNLLSTVGNLVTRPLIALMVGWRFTPELRGFFFTFYAVVSLYVFVELGLSFVVIQFASHEFAGLRMTEGCRLEGDPASLGRLHGLSRLTLRWYFLAGCLVALGLSAAGLWYFSLNPTSPGLVWKGPWVALCILTGVRLWLTPIWALLEGCNQVVHVYRYRFWDSILSTTSICAVVALGGGLWMAPAGTLTSVFCGLYHLLRHCPGFLAFLKPRVDSIPFPWLHELWPMQWRIAVTWGSSYLANQLLTVVVFHYQGAEVGGQLGMTWQLSMVLLTIASAWQVSRNPALGALAARHEWGQLDKLFAKVYTGSLLVSSLALGTAWLAINACNQWSNPTAQKVADCLLPPSTAGLIFLGAWIYQLHSPLAVYLRAHKKEPLFLVMVAYSLMLGLSNWYWGSRYGPPAIGAAYIIVNALTLPAVVVVWLRCRKAWHSHPSPD